jgi:hypothetical protein
MNELRQVCVTVTGGIAGYGGYDPSDGPRKSAILNVTSLA